MFFARENIVKTTVVGHERNVPVALAADDGLRPSAGGA